MSAEVSRWGVVGSGTRRMLCTRDVRGGGEEREKDRQGEKKGGGGEKNIKARKKG